MKQKAAGLLIVAAAVLIGASILYSRNQFGNIAYIATAVMNHSQSIVAQVESGHAVLIDVRTDAEWDAGHAAPATHFDLARLEAGEMPSLPKNVAIYVYCRTGHRAGEAKTILEQDGYMNVTNLGGLFDWQAMGGAVAQ